MKRGVLLSAIKRAVQEAGYVGQRLPGRGMASTWNLSKDGKTIRTSFRTTRNRWFAFPPMNNGTAWKTLDQVDMVVLATVDSKDDAQNVEVHFLPADEVRKRFDAAYKARVADHQVQRDNFGLWINLDRDRRGIAASVGSGLGQDFPRQASYSIAELLAEGSYELSADEEGDESVAESDAEAPPVASAAPARPESQTIAEVMALARERIAAIAGAPTSAVKLELKIEW